jgi:hypothetical protein
MGADNFLPETWISTDDSDDSDNTSDDPEDTDKLRLTQNAAKRGKWGS